MQSIQTSDTVILAAPDWLARRSAHEARVRVWTDPQQARASRGEKHPVYDFLFDYYAHRPSWLRRWHPGVGVTLTGPEAEAYAGQPGYGRTAEGVAADPTAWPAHRRDTLVWLERMLAAMQQRPAFFGCYAWHEWAMVYKLQPGDVRHARLPLRFPPERLAQIVEAQSICCSHFDAFRFFTAPARPLNRLQPERATTAEMEQRGCLHANMDLYKWAFKLAPFAPSELVADCFELALAIREVDMRASPYDVSHLGFPAIPVETPEGRTEFERLQRDFARRGEPLRERILAVVRSLLSAGTETPPAQNAPS